MEIRQKISADGLLGLRAQKWITINRRHHLQYELWPKPWSFTWWDHYPLVVGTPFEHNRSEEWNGICPNLWNKLVDRDNSDHHSGDDLFGTTYHMHHSYCSLWETHSKIEGKATQRNAGQVPEWAAVGIGGPKWSAKTIKNIRWQR